MMFKKLKQNKQINKEPMVIPITKTIRYNSKLQPEMVKKQIVQKMLDEILLYTEFNFNDMADGTILMDGRLNVLVINKGEDKDGCEEDKGNND